VLLCFVAVVTKDLRFSWSPSLFLLSLPQSLLPLLPPTYFFFDLPSSKIFGIWSSVSSPL
jgi:hypothetical protein